jgi:hypothetical protein
MDNNEQSLALRTSPAALLSVHPGRREYACRFVRAGRVRAAGNRPAPLLIEPDGLAAAAAAGKFDGKAVFVDHAGWFDYPSLKNLVGVTLQSAWNPMDQSVDGVIQLNDSPGALALQTVIDGILKDQAAGMPVPDVGLSMVFYPQFAPRDNDSEPRRITGVRYVESVDFVFEPAADGRIKAALSAAQAALAAHSASLEGGLDMATPNQEGGQTMSPEVSAQAWQQATAAASAKAIIQASSLPQAAKDRLAQASYASPEEVQEAIEAEQAYLAGIQSSQVVNLPGPAPRSPHIALGRTGLEQIQLAFDALLAGVRPPEGIAPLNGLRELYHLLSGDFDLTGVYHPDRVYLANVTSSTMAGMVANALNKLVVNEFQQYPHWWDPIVTVQDFNSLQQVKWITLGGVGELPTVAEGAAYTEMTWDDNTETSDFVKKGGYLGLTLEAIDKDDTNRLRAAPRAIAQAAWLTLSKSISYIFTQASGTGPLLADGVRLFAAGHGSNVGSTALSLTSYLAARLIMRKQTELNSGERLGFLTSPKYLLVPPDLEVTALQILAAADDYTYALSNGVSAPPNVLAQGDSYSARLASARERVIVVDLWTDTNDWALVADPRLYPCLGLAFRYGRAPEIFSVASPTAGLMFTNDTMPIKARFFYAVGPTDYRGLFKANV